MRTVCDLTFVRISVAGANELCPKAARILGAQPVVTTATDLS